MNDAHPRTAGTEIEAAMRIVARELGAQPEIASRLSGQAQLPQRWLDQMTAHLPA